MLQLGEKTSVSLHSDGGREAKEFEAELLSGTASLSATAATNGEIVASGARVRTISDARGVVQVQRVGPNQLIVFAQRGAAQISYRGDNETITEGKSYRVLLNPSDDATPGGSTRHAGTWRKPVVLIAIGAGAAVGIVLGLENRGKHKGMESPDRP